MRTSFQRTRSLVLTIPALLLLAGALGLAVPRPARAGGSAGYDPRRDPAADLKAAVHDATASGRRILLEVGGEWCPWCHVFQNLVTSDKEIGARLHAGFVVVKVNWSPENENARFLSAYPPIPSYPHFFVLDGNGTYLWSQNGAQFEKGRNGYDRNKVLAFIEQWSAHPRKAAR